jgi:hypothetical protein
MKIKEFILKERNNVHSVVFSSAVLSVFFFLFFSFISGSPFFAKASSSVGEIDSVFKFAKGVDRTDVRINFGFYRGSLGVVITDTSLSGYAWGENVGWVNLYPGGGGVSNNGEGVLSGYAASEFGGWINFNGVTINSSGEFLGYAETEKIGKLVFNCSTNNSCSSGDFKVATDWRPVSVRKNAPPDPIYVAPVVTPPVFTNPENPKKDTTTPEVKDPNAKPLPVTDVGQYRDGGDVVKKNETVIEGGQITTIRLPDGNAVPVEDQTKSTAKVIVADVVKVTKDVTDFVEMTTKDIKKDAVILTKTQAVDISTKTVTTVGVAGGGTAIVSSITGSLMSFSEFFLGFFRLWSIFLSALGLRKRREPWGTVYDSVTKQPLDPAYVVLLDKNNKEVATSITDLDGRFGFLAPPGIYHIVVKKTNYIAPSLHLHAKERDEVYDNLYFGEEIELVSSKILSKNIPMDPQGFDWNEFAKRDRNIMKFHSPRKKIFAQISSALFIVGLLFAVGLLIVKPDVYNIAILVLYVVLSILRFVKFKPKSFGTIRDKSNGFPLSFAIVRVYLKSTGREIFHRVANEYGHYYCLLAKGDYYITIEKKNADESYTKVYTSDVISVKRGIINQDFAV